MQGKTPMRRGRDSIPVGVFNGRLDGAHRGAAGDDLLAARWKSRAIPHTIGCSACVSWSDDGVPKTTKPPGSLKAPGRPSTLDRYFLVRSLLRVVSSAIKVQPNSL